MKTTQNYFQLRMLIFSMAVLLVLVLQFFALAGDAALFLTYSTFCTLIFSFSLAFNKQAAFYHPFVFILLTVFIGVTLRSFYMVYDTGNADINSFFLRDQTISYFLQPTFMLVTGFILFAAGYHLTRGKFSFRRFRLYNEDKPWSQKRLMQLTVIYFLIALAGIILFVRAIGIGSILADFSSKRFLVLDDGNNNLTASFGYYRLMASFIQPLLYIFLLNFLVEGKKILSAQGFVLILIALANLFFPIFTSSRSDLLTIFLNAFIIISLAGKLNARFLIPISLAALTLFMLVTLLRPSKTNAINTDKISLLDPFIYNRNLLDVSKTAHIVNSIPEKMPFEHGETFLALLYAPVPRTVWPDKPALSIGKDISHHIYGYSQRTLAGIPPGMPAELYLNFGYPGILIGFLLVGILLKKLFNSFQFDGPVNKNRIVLYVVIVVSITITLFGSSINQAILAVLQAYIPLYAGLKYITKKALGSS